MAWWTKIWGGSEDELYARELAAEVAASIRPELTVTRIQALSVNKTTRVLEKVLQKATEFQRREKMSFIRRARFANHVQWSLRGLGFSAEFASLVTEGLVVGALRKPMS